MDKFVTRAPTWKTMSYDVIAAGAKAVTSAKTAQQGKQQKPKPLQENVGQNKTNLSNYDADRIKQLLNRNQEQSGQSINNSNKMPDCETSQDFGNCLSETFTSTWVGDANCTNVTQLNNNNSKKSNMGNEHPEPARGIARPAYIQDSNIIGDAGIVKFGLSTPQSRKAMALKADAAARIQRDLQSPSAAVRLRAIRALRTPTNTGGYENFDVPLAEQTLITAEERIPQEPPKLQDILKDVVVYVEVRSGEDNRSEGVKKVIAALGAQVNDRLLRNTSHVVFKDGLLSTYKKAAGWNIPVVSILWIEACKNRLKLCDPKEFPISNLDQYENPELYPKMVRHKYMQPGSECTKRIRIKPTTPNSKDLAVVTPKSAIQKKLSSLAVTTPTKNTEIMQFFKVLGSNSKTSEGANQSRALAMNDCAFESPATKFLNRISSGCLTPFAMKNDTIAASPLSTERHQPITIENTSTQTSQTSSISFGSAESKKVADKDQTADPQSKRSKRRSTFDVATNTSSSSSVTSTTPGRMTRRRSLQALSSLTELGSTSSKKTSSTIIHTIAEEEMIINEKTHENVTNNNYESMEVTNLPKEKLQENNFIRRPTLFVPEDMEITLNGDSKENRQPELTKTPTVLDRNQSAERTRDSIGDADMPAMSFSSTRLPGSNRGINSFDFSMELINQRISSINELSRRRSLALLQQDNDGNSAVGHTKPLTPAPPSPTEVRRTEVAASDSTTSAVKKRKLFVPNVEFKPTSPLNSRKKAADDRKRRRTLAVMPTKDAASQEDNTGDRSSQEQSESEKTIVNQTSDDGEQTNLATSGTNSNLNEKQTQKRRRTQAIIKPPLSPLNSQQSTNKEAKPSATQAKPLKKPLMKNNARRSTLDFEQIKRITDKFKNSKTIRATQQANNSDKVDEQELANPPATTESTIESYSSIIHKISDENNEEAEKLAMTSPKRRKKPLPSLVYTNMHQEQINVIKKAVAQLGGFKLDMDVNENTTHLISLDPRRTINMLRGLMRGVWILQYRWVLESMRAKSWVREEHYEMRNFSRAVEICRAERQAFGKNYRCELFRHMESFYVSTRCRGISVTIIKELLALGNAKMEEYRWRAKYVIGDKRRDEDDRVYLAPQWVLDSIEAMQIRRFVNYLMPSAIITPNNPTYEIRQPIVERVYTASNFQYK